MATTAAAKLQRGTLRVRDAGDPSDWSALRASNASARYSSPAYSKLLDPKTGPGISDTQIRDRRGYRNRLVRQGLCTGRPAGGGRRHPRRDQDRFPLRAIDQPLGGMLWLENRSLASC